MKRKKRTKKAKALNAWHDVPYVTYGNFIYLGKCSPKTRKNAISAGLTPIVAKQVRKMFCNTQALNRILAKGRWYDTVHYDRTKLVDWAMK